MFESLNNAKLSNQKVNYATLIFVFITEVLSVWLINQNN